MSANVFPWVRDEHPQHKAGRLWQVLEAFAASDLVVPSAPRPLDHPDFCALEVPDRGFDPDAYLDFLAERVIPGSVNVSAPRCLGFMTAGVPPILRLVGGVVQCLNQNLVRADASPRLTEIQRRTLTMLHRLAYGVIAHPAAPVGALSSGGTTSNLLALWCARNRALGGAGANAEKDGMASALRSVGAERAVIVTSELGHYSLQKAAAILGIGSDSVIELPVDSAQRMDVAALEAALTRCRQSGEIVVAVVGLAGSTDFGSIDPLRQIAALTRRFGVHFHVDASWTGALLCSRRHRALLDGIEEADTITLDAHKQFQLPIGAGITLFRDPSLAALVRKTARYILQEDSDDLGKVAVEGSQSGISLVLHAALLVLGAEGLAGPAERGIATATAFADMVERHPSFELLAHPQTSIVVYRWRPPGNTADNATIDGINVLVQRRQAERGRALVSRTQLPARATIHGESVSALRAVFNKDRTTVEDLAAVLDEQSAIAAELWSNAAPVDKRGLYA